MSDCVSVTRTGNVTPDSVTSVSLTRSYEGESGRSPDAICHNALHSLRGRLIKLCSCSVFFIKSALVRPHGESIMFFPTNVCI